MKAKTYLAVDIGAGSGRVIALSYDGRRLNAETVCRFPNAPVELGGHIFWDIPRLVSDVRAGLAEAAAKYGGNVASVGIDTWGVDYVLVDKAGRMLSLPYAYRDSRNSPDTMEKVFSIAGRRRLYDRTGIQFMPFNTVFQLYSESREPCSLIDFADRLLFVPDYLNYALCGAMENEFTISSTSQLVNAGTRDWDGELLGVLGIPERLFRKTVMPGTILGPVRGVSGLEGVPVVAVGSHDTASAVASVPAVSGRSWGYIATGTWALMGVVASHAVINDLSYELSYTHEASVDGAFRFLKNCTGMWLVQQLREDWRAQDGCDTGFEELMREAMREKPFGFFIDPDFREFQSPGDMSGKFMRYFGSTGQKTEATRGQLFRAAMEGVVMRYREVWSELQQLTGGALESLNMIGGATKDAMHCQLTADALGVEVECGPVEGAAMGNALAQMKGLGDISDFGQGRSLVNESIEKQYWRPDTQSSEKWDEAYSRWKEIRGSAAAS